jgi:multiple sugar transport system ATP-binding protein
MRPKGEERLARVRLNHVYKRFGDVTAVKDFHLDI